MKLIVATYISVLLFSGMWRCVDGLLATFRKNVSSPSSLKVQSPGRTMNPWESPETDILEFKCFSICEIWGSHSGVNVDTNLPERNAVSTDQKLPIFPRSFYLKDQATRQQGLLDPENQGTRFPQKAQLHTVKAYGGKLHPSLISTSGDEWSASRPARFTPPNTRWIKGWMGPTTSLRPTYISTQNAWGWSE
jgi:hypothetical protein